MSRLFKGTTKCKNEWGWSQKYITEPVYWGELSVLRGLGSYDSLEVLMVALRWREL